MLPQELQCHVWQLLHSKRLQALHKELAEKVQLTLDEYWWSQLVTWHEIGKWSRIQHKRGLCCGHILDWGRRWTGRTIDGEAHDYVAYDSYAYIKSLGKNLVYKNSRYLLESCLPEQTCNYQLKEVCLAPWYSQ